MPEAAPATPVIQRALRKIRLTMGTWYPWDQRRLMAKLRPLTFRELEPDDIEWCEKLYDLNERCGVPPFGRDDYSAYLLSPKHLVLIASDATGRVGTFGIHRFNHEDVYLCYVLVDPGAQRSGVGTTMMTAAIALLGTAVPERNIVLTALETSLPFYRTLGYTSFHRETVGNHPLIYACLGSIPALLISDCQAMLAAAGVTLPETSRPIPFAESPLPSSSFPP